MFSVVSSIWSNGEFLIRMILRHWYYVIDIIIVIFTFIYRFWDVDLFEAELWFGESFHCLPSSSHQHTSDTKDNCKQYHQWYNTQHYSKWNCTSWNIYFSLTWLASSYVWAIEKPVCWHVICKIYIIIYM